MTKMQDCQGTNIRTERLISENVRWIRENVPFVRYPEDREYILRDRERWQRRINTICFLLRR